MIDQHVSEGVHTVTLSRPERRNALTPDGLRALETAISDTTEQVIYLTGDGPAFCAGADLDAVDALSTRNEAIEFAELGQRVARAIETTDAIVVAGIDGPARGGGVELALACDVRVATPEATVGEPGVTFGLFGAWGGTVRLPDLVGLGNAIEFSVTGRVLGAEEALRMGLVSRITDNPGCVATEIASNDHSALAVLKERLRDRATVKTRERREAEAFADLVLDRADDPG